MCIRQVEEKIPYGVVEIDDLQLKQIQEKPTNYYFVNAGIYVFSGDVKELVPTESYFDMNSLFNKILDSRHRSNVFPIHEYWVDVGRPDDLVRARKES